MIDDEQDPIAAIQAALAPQAMAPAMPVAPMPVVAPTVSQDPRQKLAMLAALAAAIAGGPKSGLGGLPRGLLAGQQGLQQDADRQAVMESRRAQIQAQQAEQELRREEQKQARRNAFVASLSGGLTKYTSKDEYDKFVDFAGQQAMLSGYSDLAPNALRVRFPFKAPSAAPLAEKMLAKWMTLPNNKKLLEEAPERAAISQIPFDRDGDGKPEVITIKELAELAGTPLAADPVTGQIVPSAKTKDPEQKANADAIFATLLDKAKAEGKDTSNPDIRLALQEEAMRRAKKTGADPLLDEQRRMRIEEMRRRQNVPDLSPAQFNMANRLADDFTRDSKDYIQRGQSYSTVLAAAKDPSAAGDLSLIYAYMKMLDPGSTVREGEFATAQNATGIPNQILNLYNRLIKGERLNQFQRDDFVRQALKVYGASKQRQKAITETYTQRARRANVPPELVIMDYGAGVEPDAPAAQDAPTPVSGAKDPQSDAVIAARKRGAGRR